LTGFEAVSLQPNAGSQGELAVCSRFAPITVRAAKIDATSVWYGLAHGTNPASAILAGMRVVVVNCDDSGNVDLADLARKIAEHREELAALMITYPRQVASMSPRFE